MVSLISKIISRQKYRAIVLWEMCRGLDFSRVANNIVTEVKEDSGNYFSSSALFPEFKKALKLLNISRVDSIYDFGVGKGATLVAFSRFPFNRIGGCELSAILVKIARRNLNTLGLLNVQIDEVDARLCFNLDCYNYFYFYNPFPRHVMCDVLNNILESAVRNPRKIRIIYCNPEHHESIVQNGGFVLLNVVKSNIGNQIVKIYEHDGCIK